jgi:hypothetical protein
MTTLARKLRLIDYFALGFGVMVGTAWLIVMVRKVISAFCTAKPFKLLVNRERRSHTNAKKVRLLWQTKTYTAMIVAHARFAQAACALAFQPADPASRFRRGWL